MFDLVVIYREPRSLEIRFIQDPEDLINCELRNINGSLIWKSVQNCRTTADKRILINTDDFPPGIYLFRLTSKEQSQGVKIILH